jgi:hypothetical protein
MINVQMSYDKTMWIPDCFLSVQMLELLHYYITALEGSLYLTDSDEI